jgi:hypothetical protein
MVRLVTAPFYVTVHERSKNPFAMAQFSEEIGCLSTYASNLARWERRYKSSTRMASI